MIENNTVFSGFSDFAGSGVAVNTNYIKAGKYPEYSRFQDRLHTFSYPNWKLEEPDETLIAEAGFFNIGVEDIVTCYFCGGSLKDWKPSDDPWVEHRKYFRVCPLVVNHEKELHQNEKQLQTIECSFTEKKNDTDLIRRRVDKLLKTPRVEALMQNGVTLQKIKKVLKKKLEKTGEDFASVEALYTATESIADDDDDDDDDDENFQNELVDDIKLLREENKQLKDLKTCKICMDQDVSVTFLPCGHFICCRECGMTVHKCPLCRKDIESIVKTFMN